MATTYTLISSNTVGSGGVASVTFSSIPATYTDLLLKVSARTNRASGSDIIKMQLNGDTGNNYSLRNLTTNDGATVISQSSTSIAFNYGGIATTVATTANTFGNSEVYIPNYTGSNQKSSSVDMVIENNATASTLLLGANIWTGTVAITSITLTPNVGTSIDQYSTFYLYGISNA
jgi:hypothetical protein